MSTAWLLIHNFADADPLALRLHQGGRVAPHPIHRPTGASFVGARLTAVPARLTELAALQHGVLTRDQLRAAGFGKDHVRAAVSARRWQRFGRRVVVLHNTALTDRQREWVAVLIAGQPAALAGLSAAAAAGLTGFPSDEVHIVVAHDHSTHWPPWVKVHDSRRFSPLDIQPNTAPPRTRFARSVVDAAAWSSDVRWACAIMCAAVQQHRTTADRLAGELRRAGAVRHVAALRALLGDVSGGGHTLAEIELAPLALHAGLPLPRRQVLRRQPDGRARYVDAEFDLPDGTVLGVEIDGAVHLEPVTWWDDMSRHNELTIARQPILRFPSMMVRLAPEQVIDHLRRAREAHERVPLAEEVVPIAG